MRIRRFSFILLFFYYGSLQAQKSELAKKVFELINQCRTNPAAFLSANRDRIASLQPKFIPILEKAKPIPPMIWDEGLENMAVEAIEKNNLNPTYNGKNALCGFTKGRGKGTPLHPLDYVCDNYTVINSPDYGYVGFYFNSSKTAYSFFIGKSCGYQNALYEFTGTIDSSAVDFDALNTAKNASYLSETEKRMILEINFVRAYPQIYARLVAQYLDRKSHSFGGLSQDELNVGFEVIAELEKAEPVSILQPSECVYKIARKHGLDCQARGVIDHTGSDGSDPFVRMSKICPQMASIGENLAGNTSLNPRDPLIDLLIDEGISSRGHRYTILAPHWKYVACFRFVAKKTAHYTLYGWVQNFTR